MAQDGGVSSAVSSAKTALAHAQKSFPSPAPKPAAPAAPAAKPAPYRANIGAELKAKSDNVDAYVKSLPKMHKGGAVLEDGPVVLKAGEHVLTAAEVKKARKHALMAAGMKSLIEPAQKKTAGQPAEQEDIKKQSATKPVSGIKVRPEKNQAAKIKVQA